MSPREGLKGAFGLPQRPPQVPLREDDNKAGPQMKAFGYNNNNIIGPFNTP